MSQDKIMVVEDDVISAEALREKLTALGYRVPALAVSGEEAIELAGRVLPDLRLSGALDGIEAAERIQARQDVPVLYLTAYTDEETLQRAKLSAPYSYLVKPARDRELHITVEMALHRHRLEKILREQYGRLQEMERLKDDLIQMIVHDMRSPLTVILGNIELAQTAVERGKAGAGTSLEAALQGAESLMGMIDSLLDISRLEEGKMPIQRLACDLHDLADMSLAALRPLAGKKNISLSLSGAPTQITADPALVRRVFDNLLGNAVKFTPPGGTIRLSVAAAGLSVRAEVRDSAPVIPEEFHERIFEKFGQVETAGHDRNHATGLGLTFCKLAVEAHGGKIGVESDPGRGNIFWFTLPARA
jgi:signal transduction histidine kinase